MAESKDSIAPRMAIVIAGDTNPFMTFHDIEGISASGNWFEIENLSPIVSTLSTPAYCLSSSTATVITMMAIQVASLLSGAVITETVFAIPGIGRLAVDAITSRDMPLLQGTVLFTTVLIILGNLIAAILYSVIDPRIRES